MTSLGLELLALAVYGPAVILWHELGHLLFARAGGLRATSFGIGTGRPILRLRLSGGLVVWVGAWVLVGGSATAVPIAPAGPRRAWFHAGGLLAQLVLAAALLPLVDVWWIERMARFNALVWLTNAAPWRLAGGASDGMALLDLWRGRRAEDTTLPDRAALARRATREAQIGSDLGEAWARLALAWADTRAGRLVQAAPFLERDTPVLALAPWADALHQYVRAEWHRRSGRPLAALGVIRSARALHGAELTDDASDLLSLAEAQALVALDEPRAAQRLLGRLAGVGGAIGRQAAVVNLAASLDGPASDLALAARAAVQRAAGPWLDPAEAAEVLWDAADALAATHPPAAAAPVRAAARRLARAVLDAASDEERPGLLARLGPAAGLRRHPARSAP